MSEICTNIFHRVIKSFLDDDLFKLNSLVAVEARNVTEAVLKWYATESKEVKLDDFARRLLINSRSYLYVLLMSFHFQLMTLLLKFQTVLPTCVTTIFHVAR